MTNESNTPDIDYALTLMDCWGRDENQPGPGGACRLAAQVIRFLRASPEPETLVVTKTFNEALKELTSGPYEPWQVTKLQLDHQQAEITQLREENQALRNLAQNLRPGPISEALVGASHEPNSSLSASDFRICLTCGTQTRGNCVGLWCSRENCPGAAVKSADTP